MWSTELENSLAIVKPATVKGLSKNDEDLGDINFCLRDGEVQGKRDGCRLSTMDVLAGIKANDIEYIANLPLKNSDKKPFETKKGKMHSMRHFTDEFLLEHKPEHTVRTVEIVRTKSDPLGFYIRQGDGITNRTGIFISRILRGSLVDCSGVLKSGDEILKVNHVDVRGFTLSDIVKLIQVPKPLLILTVRISHRLQHPRPKFSSRHSSPSLLSGAGKESKSAHKSMTKAKSKAGTFNQVTENNEQKYKQRDEYGDRVDANKSCSDLSKNTPTTDDFIRILRTQNQDEKVINSENEFGKRSEKVFNSKTERENHIDLVCDEAKKQKDKMMSCTSQLQFQIDKQLLSSHPRNQASTIVPSTTVNLLFDDEETNSTTSAVQIVTSLSNTSHQHQHFQVNKPDGTLTDNNIRKKEESHSQQVKVDTLTVTSPAKSSRSRGSSASGSPKMRRKLPSVPVDLEGIKKNEAQNESSHPRKHLAIPGNADHKLHRKLPTPPASPIMGYKRSSSESQIPEQTGPRSLCMQKENRRSQNTNNLNEIESSTKELKPSDKNPGKNDDNNNSRGEMSETKTELLVKAGFKTKDSALKNDKKPQEKGKPSAHVFKPTPYRRSQSQYTDFFEQQRHSMFLQSYAFGKMKGTSGVSRNTIKDHSIENNASLVAEEDLLEVPPKKSVFEKEKVNFKPNFARRSPGAMRRHASSSLLLNKSYPTKSATSQDIKIASHSGFLLYPDDYKDDEISCSHAVSGMIQVRVIQATNLFFADKKQTKKIYCTIEVDFERKAFTTAKKATKNPNWDEVFEIEVQHGREMTFMCSNSNKEFERPVGRASFYLKPLIRRGQNHQMILRLKPEGLLYIELEFTELKTLLQRAPSGKQTGVFGFNLSVTSELECSSIPIIVRKCVEEIEKRGIHSVGLYRISGNARRKEELRAKFDENSNMVDTSNDNCPDINVLTGILKDYLRELPEPLITEKMSQDLILGVQDNIQDKSPTIQGKFLSKLLSELPDTNRNTLIYILNHLCRVINDEQNRMDCRSLSVCLAPVLQCSPKNLSESKDLLNLKMYLKTVEALLEMWNVVEGLC